MYPHEVNTAWFSLPPRESSVQSHATAVPNEDTYYLTVGIAACGSGCPAILTVQPAAPAARYHALRLRLPGITHCGSGCSVSGAHECSLLIQHATG